MSISQLILITDLSMDYFHVENMDILRWISQNLVPGVRKNKRVISTSLGRMHVLQELLRMWAALSKFVDRRVFVIFTIMRKAWYNTHGKIMTIIRSDVRERI